MPLKPNQIPTTAPAGRAGTAGAAAGRVPSSITSGWYTETAPVAGSRIEASTKAACCVFASWQAPFPSEPCRRYGVASPAALVGARGTTRVQFGLGWFCCCRPFRWVFFCWSDGCVPPAPPPCAASGAALGVVGDVDVVVPPGGGASPRSAGCGPAPSRRPRPVIAAVTRESSEPPRAVRALLFDVEELPGGWVDDAQACAAPSTSRIERGTATAQRGMRLRVECLAMGVLRGGSGRSRGGGPGRGGGDRQRSREAELLGVHPGRGTASCSSAASDPASSEGGPHTK